MDKNKNMAVSRKDFYKDLRPTLILYKIIGLTSLKNVFSGPLEFQLGFNFIWPLVCTYLLYYLNDSTYY